MSVEHCSKLTATDGRGARWSGSEFQTTGAAMKKLRLPSLVVLVRGTNRLPRLAEWWPGRPELSARLCRQCYCSSRIITVRCLPNTKILPITIVIAAVFLRLLLPCVSSTNVCCVKWCAEAGWWDLRRDQQQQQSGWWWWWQW